MSRRELFLIGLLAAVAGLAGFAWFGGRPETVSTGNAQATTTVAEGRSDSTTTIATPTSTERVATSQQYASIVALAEAELREVSIVFDDCIVRCMDDLDEVYINIAQQELHGRLLFAADATREDDEKYPYIGEPPTEVADLYAATVADLERVQDGLRDRRTCADETECLGAEVSIKVALEAVLNDIDGWSPWK